MLPEHDDYDSTENAHRAFAASQCARTAAEHHAPPLLLRRALAAMPPSPPHPVAPNCRVPPPPAARDVASRTLSHAAQARAAALTASLRAGNEAGGLRMDEGEADHLANRLVQLLEGAAAHNTLKGERSAWRHWMAFCVHRNVNPFRRDVRTMSHEEYDVELVTLALALLFVYGRMGCRKGRTTAPRPASALAVLRSIRRAHDRLGVKMADLSLATKLADSLNREYIDAHGWEALQVDRVAPLNNQLVEGMIEADNISGDDLGHVMARALWSTLAQTGFRKAEVSLGSGARFGPDCLTRHNLRWRISGQLVADPSEEQLLNMQDGDLAILIPPKSKCDQFGLEWGQAPIYLRFSATAPINAARRLRDVERRLPLRGRHQREGTALFTTDAGCPLTSSALDTLFKSCLRRAGVPSNATARYSPHSFRRYLACALRAQGAADSTIQALLRWKTTESLKLYSFLNDESYADLVDSAGSADVSTVRTNALPRAELLDAASSFHTARSRLVTAARAAEATDPAEDDCGDDADSSESGEDDDDAPPAQPPPPQRGARKRTRSAGQASSSSAPPPLPPLTLDNAVGRTAIVPASLWPSETCNEHEGSGWEVTIDQVDRRLNAVQVYFVRARHTTGVRYAKEWLAISALLSPSDVPHH